MKSNFLYCVLYNANHYPPPCIVLISIIFSFDQIIIFDML